MRRASAEEGKEAQESAAKRRNVEEKAAPARETAAGTATATAFSRVRKGKLVMKGARKAAGDQPKEHTPQSASERLDERCRKKGDRHCR